MEWVAVAALAGIVLLAGRHGASSTGANKGASGGSKGGPADTTTQVTGAISGLIASIGQMFGGAGGKGVSTGGGPSAGLSQSVPQGGGNPFASMGSGAPSPTSYQTEQGTVIDQNSGTDTSPAHYTFDPNNVNAVVADSGGLSGETNSQPGGSLDSPSSGTSGNWLDSGSLGSLELTGPSDPFTSDTGAISDFGPQQEDGSFYTSDGS